MTAGSAGRRCRERWNRALLEPLPADVVFVRDPDAVTDLAHLSTRDRATPADALVWISCRSRRPESRSTSPHMSCAEALTPGFVCAVDATSSGPKVVVRKAPR